MTSELGEASPVTYEQLAELEHGFDDIDVEMIRTQYLRSRELYARRKEVVAGIAGFWPLVLESAPPEIDRYIQPSDSEIFASALRAIDVDRFEISGAGGDGCGEPRSLAVTFEFDDNEWFHDRAIEKRFWWRRASDGWTGLVSEPVRVHWRKGKDPTKGLMDGALDLWNARQQAGDMRKRDLTEFDRMARITESWNGDNTSFFTWFAFVSSRRWVSAEESAVASKAEAARRKGGDKGAGGGDTGVQVPEHGQLEGQVEAHEDGDGLATVIAEDLWPGAIRYFTQAQEDSDDEFEEEDEEADADAGSGSEEDEHGGGGGGSGKLNLRELTAPKGRGQDGRDSKRRRMG